MHCIGRTKQLCCSVYDEYSKRALGVSTVLSVLAQYKHLGMYTWSRVLAAISKKCDPKVLVARQVVWLDAACYRPHTLIWWRRLWIWLRHSSIGIATHWHTWALLHTFRIFFLSTPGCIHSHFVIPSVLSEAKMSFKTLPFPTKSYWLSNSLSALCWSLSKVQIWWLGVSTGVQKINHRRCGLEVDVHPCVSSFTSSTSLF